MARLTDITGRPTSGTVPHAVVGIVTENVDPDALGRIKVKFPTLVAESGDVLSFWLRQATPNGGKERGLYSLPEVDDEVLVIFMQGSQDVGVIIGQFWNGKDGPPVEAGEGAGGSVYASKNGTDATPGAGAIDTNDRRFWRSRSGHLLIFDDKDGSETVELWDKSRSLSLVFDTANKIVQLSNADGDLEISAGGNINLTAGKTITMYAGKNIEVEAAMDTTWKAGKNHKMEAGMDAKFKAGMNFAIEGGMDFKAKGGMNAKIEGGMMFEAKGGIQATLKGGAMAVVKGAIVMLN